VVAKEFINGHREKIKTENYGRSAMLIVVCHWILWLVNILREHGCCSNKPDQCAFFSCFRYTGGDLGHLTVISDGFSASYLVIAFSLENFGLKELGEVTFSIFFVLFFLFIVSFTVTETFSLSVLTSYISVLEDSLFSVLGITVCISLLFTLSVELSVSILAIHSSGWVRSIPTAGVGCIRVCVPYVDSFCSSQKKTL
jgi:hypothetical protein